MDIKYTHNLATESYPNQIRIYHIINTLLRSIRVSYIDQLEYGFDATDISNSPIFICKDKSKLILYVENMLTLSVVDNDDYNFLLSILKNEENVSVRLIKGVTALDNIVNINLSIANLIVDFLLTTMDYPTNIVDNQLKKYATDNFSMQSYLYLKYCELEELKNNKG